MTIRTLAAAIPDHPELGRVKVPCPDCREQDSPKWCHRCSETGGVTIDDCLSEGGWRPRLTILTCTRLEEVGEMVGIKSACLECGNLFTPVRGWHARNSCNGADEAVIQVSQRIFIWNGEPVDWPRLIYDCSECGELRLAPGEMWLDAWKLESFAPGYQPPCRWLDPGCDGTLVARPLTAVVLVKKVRAHRLYGLPKEIKDAAQACAEARVQFIVPGDPERGRLEL